MMRQLIPLLKAALCGLACIGFSDAIARSDLTLDDTERVEAVVAATKDFSKPEPFENRPAGAATSLSTPDRNAFSQPQPNLSFSDREQFSLGNALFRKLWVSSPSSTLASDGLGPLFNARACQACHIKDGRGHLSTDDSASSSFVIRLGMQDSKTGQWVPDPVYGQQIQTVAVPGLIAEASIKMTSKPKRVLFKDGTVIQLRAPEFSFETSGYKNIDPRAVHSVRVAPPMIGMGLLAAISVDDLMALEDPQDSDEDGISGRRAMVKMGDQLITGRFGHKAVNATVEEQVAGAFSIDMGLSTSIKTNNTGDCSESQVDCLKLPHGEQSHLGKGEVPDNLLSLVSFYSSNLAPPARRDADSPDVLAGKELFYEAGCTGCHTPKYVTSREVASEQHRFQLIWPYSDLLLHDMGEELADALGNNAGALGQEWRTPPLWGIGLMKKVNPKATYLHDGRAQTLLEAVLWHGGEGAIARDRVLNMDESQRNLLTAFLESL